MIARNGINYLCKNGRMCPSEGFVSICNYGNYVPIGKDALCLFFLFMAVIPMSAQERNTRKVRNSSSWCIGLQGVCRLA